MAKAKSKKIAIEEALVPIEEQPYDIPENWCWTRIKYVSDVVTGNTPSKKNEEYYGGDFPFFKPADLDAGDNVVEASEYLSEEGKNVSRIIPKLSTAVCCIGSIGKSGFLRVEGTTNQQINSMIPKINPLYLYYYSKTNEFVTELWNKSTATTISLVNKNNMETNTIPLAPLAEQKRIVEQIENLFAELDAAREKAEFVISCFEERKVAIIHKAFDGVLTRKWREANNVSCDSWKMIPLKNCGRWFGGGTPTTSVGAYWENGDIPWITSKDMKDRVIEDSIMHITMDGVENSSANYCDEPAVLFVMRSGILRRIFPVCMVNRPFTVNQDLKACVPTINQEYLYWFCTGYEKDIRDNCMKSGTTVESVEAKKLMDYEVPVASANEQIEVVKQIEELINKEEIVKELAENVIEKIDVMKKSILAKAFRGELGTNIPEEESSIELLKKMIEEG